MKSFGTTSVLVVNVMVGFFTGCAVRESPGGPGGDEPATTTFKSASVPAERQATWTNLWGSWPAARYSHAMAYDTDRKRIVIYGGQTGANGPYLGDVWEWNAERGHWIQRTPKGAVVGTRSGHAMDYDPVAKKMFLFGGWQPGGSLFAPGQYEWDGATETWSRRLIAGAEPVARHDHTMVYDPDRRRMVLFGGIDEAGTRRNDLWEWDGATGTWTERTTASVRPAGRWGHSMAYDSVRKKMIVRSGNTGTGSGTWVNETWEWDGAAGTWTQLVTTGTAPQYSTSAGYQQIGFDTARGKIVLFTYSDYVYELDPVTPTWTPVTSVRPSTAVPPYGFHGVIYNPDRARLTLFGGQTYGRTLWEWNGTDGTWADRSAPTVGPVQRSYPAVAFDSTRGKLMLFGGRSTVDNLYKQDIYEWSGVDQNWVNLTSLDTKPAPRYQTAMVYDSTRSRLLLYGGYGTTSYDDLWAWSPTTMAWTLLTVSGTRPPAMYGHWMFYDRTRDRVVLFYSSFQVWELNPANNTWTNRTVSPQPTILSGRSYYEISYDTDRSKLLLIGGHYMGVYGTDIVEWDAATGVWTAKPPAAGTMAPVGRYYHAATYDSGRRVFVLFGGHGYVTGLNEQLNDSWEWDPASSIWTQTTPAGVKPQPRENHLLTYDAARGVTFMFGGTVSSDSTYGPQEIWEYVPNSQPRPNGSGCTAANAASCQSGNCVDGVCCAQTAAQCNGVCRACNVPGSLGTCANVPVGLPDNTCASDQVCDAAQQCKSRNGRACATGTECASGFCADGVCCDTACNTPCKVCNLNAARGTCTNTPAGEEDLGGGTCASDGMQGRFCDGNGVCTNAPKPNGRPCTASGQCMSGFCIDGFCCNTACNGVCQTCGNAASPGVCGPVAVGLQDFSATDPCDGAMEYCNGAGTCAMNKRPNGATCAAAAECGSNYCVDGRCCNSACAGTCQSCAVAGSLGSCVNLPPGSQDMMATVPCAGAQYCDMAGTCQSGLKPNGASCTAAAECGSSFCADGVCCNAACTGPCLACNLTGSAGTCTGVPTGSNDPTATTPCMAPNYCTADHMCTTGKKPNGAVCASDLECGSNFCVDGVCCESACLGKCRTCAGGKCAFAADGQDPRSDCVGEKTCGGTCNGQGACRFAPNGLACSEAGCQSDGYIRGPGTCDGAGHCMAAETTPCNGFACYTDPADGMAKCRTDCADDPHCAARFYCQTPDGGAPGDGGATSDAGVPGSACPSALPLGQPCTRNTQCLSGTCSDGVCCNVNCDKCGSCNTAGSLGTCIPIPAGTDPEGECADNASDPTGLCKGFCNGRAGCTYVAAGTTCGTCKSCNGSGLCSIMPEDDSTCGDIDCDSFDTDCLDYRDLRTRRCASLGMCKTASVQTCTDVTNVCDPDAGVPRPDGGAGGSGGRDGGNDGGQMGGGGGGCCAVAGPQPPTALSLLLFAFVWFVRRRRR